MFDANPSLIQNGLRRSAVGGTTPLVLIHDGGGTTYSYYLLEDLGRMVLGIANPHFKTGEPWVGGLHEMATHYAGLVARSITSDSVILGGWSLGGLLALETAYVMSKFYPDKNVVGLIMIDSICPLRPPGGWGPAEARLVERRIDWPATTKLETRLAVENCFREAYKMVRHWMPPQNWRLASSVAGQALPSDINNARKKIKDMDYNTSRPPPAVLLRSRELVPMPSDQLLHVDLFRQEPCLGWDNYRRDMFCRIIDIPGNHFSVFSFEHLDTISNSIKLACQTLEDI